MRNRVLFLLLLAFALLARPASADPLQVTNGAFLVDIEGDMFTLNGAGFSLATTGVGNYATKLFPARCSGSGWPFQSCPQAEGSLGDWSFRTTGGEQLLGTGDVMLGGMNATNVDFVGSMRFDVVPTPVSSGGKLEFPWSAPFAFEGMIRGIQGGEELFARQFIGSGLVMLGYEATFGPGLVGLNADTDTIRYQFAEPVPEPGTLVLLGSGLAAAVLRRRRPEA